MDVKCPGGHLKKLVEADERDAGPNNWIPVCSKQLLHRFHLSMNEAKYTQVNRRGPEANEWVNGTL